MNTSTPLSYKSHVIKSKCDNNHNKYKCWKTWTNKINERKSKKKKNFFTDLLKKWKEGHSWKPVKTSDVLETMNNHCLACAEWN